MKNILREYIRELIATFLAEKNIVNEPDKKTGDHKLEMSTLGGMAITGAIAPSLPDPKEEEEDEDVNCRSFGGGTYKE